MSRHEATKSAANSASRLNPWAGSGRKGHVFGTRPSEREDASPRPQSRGLSVGGRIRDRRGMAQRCTSTRRGYDRGAAASHRRPRFGEDAHSCRTCRSIADGDTGGTYTVKVFHRIQPKVDGKRKLTTELRLLNAAYQSLVIEEEDRLRIFATVVEVLRGSDQEAS